MCIYIYIHMIMYVYFYLFVLVIKLCFFIYIYTYTYAYVDVFGLTVHRPEQNAAMILFCLFIYCEWFCRIWTAYRIIQSWKVVTSSKSILVIPYLQWIYNSYLAIDIDDIELLIYLPHRPQLIHLIIFTNLFIKLAFLAKGQQLKDQFRWDSVIHPSICSGVCITYCQSYYYYHCDLYYMYIIVTITVILIIIVIMILIM